MIIRMYIVPIGPPQDLHLESIGIDWAKISWTPPLFKYRGHERGITGYDILLDDTIIEDTIDLSYTFTNLKPKTEYVVMVLPKNQVGSSNQSNAGRMVIETKSYSHKEL